MIYNATQRSSAPSPLPQSPLPAAPLGATDEAWPAEAKPNVCSMNGEGLEDNKLREAEVFAKTLDGNVFVILAIFPL